jgi:hypothetical protein
VENSRSEKAAGATYDLDGSTRLAEDHPDKPCIENLDTFRTTADNSQHNFRIFELKHNFNY